MGRDGADVGTPDGIDVGTEVGVVGAIEMLGALVG